MRSESDRYKSFTRRAAALAGMKLALLGLLGARMYQLQVVQADRYATLAEENRINLRLLPPPRGRITDRRGQLLAVNRQNYRVLMTVERAGDAEVTLDALGRFIFIGEGDRKRVLREVGRKRSFVPVTVRENLDWSDVARIEVNAPDLPGVTIDVGRSRFYPGGDIAAHVLGYVSAVSEEDLNGDPLLELPGFKIGKSGVEKAYDEMLRGRAGSSQVEVNAIGRIIRELSRQEGEPGQDIALTIDLDLQSFAAKRIAEKSAAAVVLDVQTGEVLAIVSTPGFDPNAFTSGLSTADWNALVNNVRSPLTNKAVAGQYAPGSTFKMIVALAALESGVASPEQTVFCNGKYELGNGTFHCWKRWGHGRMNMGDAIAESCDVFFYDLARRVGIDRIAEMAGRFGLGQDLGVDIPGERPGLMPTKAWKLATQGIAWQLGETLVAAIGQGFVLTTPLQLAVMTARMVNGGRAIVPRLTRREMEDMDLREGGNTDLGMGIAEAHLQVIRRGMDEVVNGPSGTAWPVRADDEALAFGGKTGTAQVRRISERERQLGVRKNEDLPWHMRDHALFVGYAPLAEPRYAIAVVVEHGGGGSKVAAPIARDILLEVQRLDPARSTPQPLALAR
ncbi:MAG: penicillin-binding protein 2 [Rhodospirillaceae bacterium]|jgi:penicillin-binding protein 2|nr:penicillin-binding protein 2 [Rhodospirillaceae bacterium]MBT5414854.1 penicillin-binding protein 2 [Rhodospirillaceae bacterium]